MLSKDNSIVSNREMIFSGKSLTRVLIPSLLNKLDTLTLPIKVKDIITKYKNEYREHSERYTSFMAEKFHPINDPSSFLAPRMKDMEWLVTKTGISLPKDIKNPICLQEWVDQVGKTLGIIKIRGFVKTSNKKVEFYDRGAKETRGWTAPNHIQAQVKYKKKFRKTCSAKFDLIPFPKMVDSPFTNHSDRMRGIKCLSVLQGRLHIWGESWITANALPIAKTGLVTSLMEEKVLEMSGDWDKFVDEYPTTFTFMSILISVFSERKGFTLESQKQGGLNTYMKELLELVKTDEPSGLPIVGLILPIREVYSNLSKKDVELVYHTSMKWLKTFAPFLDKQWKKGVNKSVRRLCRVLPRGSGVNSSGYNAVADAWQNLRRFQTIASEYAEIKDAPIILKVLQLIADDQFKMANGKIDPNTYVFKALTREVLPWNAVMRPESYDTRKALSILFRECQKNSVPVSSWIAVSEERKDKVSKPVEMICGVPVPPMSSECANFLKGLGIYGAREWNEE